MILSIIGISWISFVFVQGDKISDEIILESSNSHDLKMSLEGKGIGYYKVFMPEFSGEQIFVQILDNNQNIISEESVQTKMSVGYFDFEKGGSYTVKVTNPSKNQISLQIELGDAGEEVMIPPGMMILVGAVMVIFSSYMRLKNYRIEHPDKNIL